MNQPTTVPATTGVPTSYTSRLGYTCTVTRYVLPLTVEYLVNQDGNQVWYQATELLDFLRSNAFVPVTTTTAAYRLARARLAGRKAYPNHRTTDHS